MKTIYCRIIEEQIDPAECRPKSWGAWAEDGWQCRTCRNRPGQKQKPPGLSPPPEPSQVEAIFTATVFPYLENDLKLSIHPFKDWLIGSSKTYLEDYEVWKPDPRARRPFPVAKTLQKHSDKMISLIEKSYPDLRPWISWACDGFIEPLKTYLQMLSHQAGTITPEAGTIKKRIVANRRKKPAKEYSTQIRNRPVDWPRKRYFEQLAMVYELASGERASPSSDKFKKFAIVCFKNLGTDLNDAQIDTLCKNRRKDRSSLYQ